MRIFLTGATGFIGSRALRVLIDAGCDVLALVRPDDSLWRLHDLEKRLRFVRGDLTDLASYRSTLEKWQPEACIHLAWYAEPDKYLYSPENLASLSSSLLLLRTLIEIRCAQVVMAGTCAEYDTDLGYLREEGPTRPKTIYAATKLAMCLIGQQMAASAGIRFAWARFFYLYGPKEDKKRLVPAAINSLIEGEPFSATPAEQVRDYLYVDDVATALWTLANNQANGVFNISSGIPMSVAELLKTIGDILGRPDLIHLGSVPYREWEPMFICGNNQRLRNLGWQPRFPLREGLEQTINSWRSRL